MREYLHELCRRAGERHLRQISKALAGLLGSAVRMHARRMSEKLVAPPYTTDYAVLLAAKRGSFLRSAADSGARPERVQQESRMVIAGPTTLAALKFPACGWASNRWSIEQRTQEALNLLGAIRTGFFAGFAASARAHTEKLRRATEERWIMQAAFTPDHRQAPFRRINGVPESEAKKLLGLTDDEEEDEWD
ncbi:MAG: hypothetical protein ACLVB5_03775 [Christensenellales bacterium]